MVPIPSYLEPCSAFDLFNCVRKVFNAGVACVARRKENDLRSVERQTIGACCFPQNSFASVAIHRVAKSLRRNEGDFSQAAFVILQNCSADEPVINPLSAGEDLIKLPFGFDGLHKSPRR